MRSKDKKIVTLLIVAILVAAVGGVLLYMFLNPQKTTIYTFKENYKAGQIISDEILTPVTVDSKVVVAGKTQDASTQFITGENRRELLDAKQNALRMDVAKGMPLTQSMLSVDGGSYIEMAMNDKKVAVTIAIDSISGVTADLTEGARVNIYATDTSKNGGTTLIFENMRVLSIGKNENGALSSATVEVTPEESVKLIDAANHSKMYFGLVNGSGYKSVGSDSSNQENEDEVFIPSDIQVISTPGASGTDAETSSVSTEEPAESATAEETEAPAEETSATSAEAQTDVDILQQISAGGAPEESTPQEETAE